MKFLITIFTVFSVVFSYCQETGTDIRPLKLKYDYVSEPINRIKLIRDKNGMMGAIDSLGKEIIPAIFDYINIFQDGRAQAGKISNGKMRRGLIDGKGNIIVPLIYDNIFNFSKERSIVMINAKYGVIDSIGNIVIPVKYDYITSANENRFIVREGTAEALFDNNGNPITPFKFKSMNRFQEGWAAVSLSDGSSTLINTDGVFAFTPLSGHQIIDFSKGFGRVRNLKTNKYGVFNKSGIIVIPCIYDSLEIHNGRAVVTHNGKSGIYSFENREISPIVYKNIFAREENLFLVEKEDFWGVINLDDKIILPILHKRAEIYQDHFILADDKVGKTAVYDLSGKSVLSFKYEFYNMHDNTVFCGKDSKYYLLDLADPGNPQILPGVAGLKKHWVYSYDQKSYCIFIENGKYGVIDLRGEKIIPPIYEGLEITHIYDEFIAESNGKYGIINLKHNIIQKIEFDKILVRKEYAELLKKNAKPVYYSFGSYVNNK